MARAKSVDEYIASAPRGSRKRLYELRRLIKAAAPHADERISYGMPYYHYKGRLVYFRPWKSYTGIYIPPPIINKHSKELKNYITTKSAVHLPNDKPLPIALLKKLVKARMKFLEKKIRKTTQAKR